LPVVALLNTAGVPLSYAVLLAGVPGIVALAGHLSLGLALCWIIEGFTLFLFVPVLALLFLLTGLVLAVREYSAEQAILALAMPAAVPLGLAPAVVLTTISLHGLAGVLTVAWGGVMAVVVALAQGAPTSGPFVASGLIFRAGPDLISTNRAISARDAIVDVF